MHNALVEAFRYTVDPSTVIRIGLAHRTGAGHRNASSRDKYPAKQTPTRHGSGRSQPSSTTSGSQHEVPKAHHSTEAQRPHSPLGHIAMASPQPHAKRGNAIGPLDRPGPSGGGAPLQYSTRTPPSNPSKQAQRHTRNGRSILSSPGLHATQLLVRIRNSPTPQGSDAQRDQTTPPV